MEMPTEVMALPRNVVIALRRHSILIMGIFVLAAVVVEPWSTGTVLPLQQHPLPASLRGHVEITDRNGDCSDDNPDGSSN